MIDFSKLLDQLQSQDWTPLILAVVLGGIIGFEREVHGRPAGLRTHILVCLASTILILAGNNVAEEARRLQGLGNLVFDPNRLGAGIVTGIGGGLVVDTPAPGRRWAVSVLRRQVDRESGDPEQSAVLPRVRVHAGGGARGSLSGV